MAYSKDGLEERLTFLEAVQNLRNDAARIAAGLHTLRDRLLTEETSTTVQAKNPDGSLKFVSKDVPALDAQGQPVMENGVAKMTTVQVNVMETRIIPATYGKPREHGQELPDAERNRRYDHYDDEIRTLISSIPTITLAPAAGGQSQTPSGGSQQSSAPPPRKGA